MQFGQFYLLETPPGKDHAQVYHEAFEQFKLMDETGWDAIWLAEHHFDHKAPGANYYSITPSIHTMAAYASAITERIKIGTAVVVLPFHNPVIVAEDFATVDIMSRGRLLFGVGRGYQLEEFHNWGIDLEESRDRFQEELEIILKAWTGPVEYDGRFHKVRKVNVIPKPVQQPHPPVYVAAVSPSTYEWVIKNGYNVLTSFLHPYEQVFELYEAYHKTADACGMSGKLDFPLARFLYVAETTEKAREECHDQLMWYFRTLLAEVIAPPARNRATRTDGILPGAETEVFQHQLRRDPGGTRHRGRSRFCRRQNQLDPETHGTAELYGVDPHRRPASRPGLQVSAHVLRPRRARVQLNASRGVPSSFIPATPAG